MEVVRNCAETSSSAGAWPGHAAPELSQRQDKTPALTAAPGAIVVSTPSYAELNKHLIRTYTKVVFNERQTGRAAEFLGPDVTWHGSTGPTVKGRDNVSALIREVVGALNGLTATEQYMIAEDDTIAVRYLIEATGSGELFGIPATGRRIRWEPTSLYRLAGGKIVNAVTFDDLAWVLHDVGGPPRSARA
jgi:predicted ester cyclase